MATWGQRRQWLIGSLLVLGVLIVGGAVTASLLYKAPSCVDGKQNQNENGIDCGGPCPYLCAADVSQPIVQFVTPVFPEQNRTDVIAYIQNSNQSVGVQHAKYTIELHDASGALVSSRTGTVNLPPNTIAPIYIPHAYDGLTIVTQAFLTLDPQSLVWPRSYNQAPVTPGVETIQVVNQDSTNPKVTAVLVNPTAHPMYGVTMVATVFDAQNNAIAASQTLVTTLPSQGTAPLVFTWNTPFRTTPARVDIRLATGP